jgi:hypothetical protein
VKKRCAIHQIHAAAIARLRSKMLQRDRMQISTAFGGQNSRINLRIIHAKNDALAHFTPRVSFLQ